VPTDESTGEGRPKWTAWNARTADGIGLAGMAAMLLVTAWLITGPQRDEQARLQTEVAGHRAFLARARQIHASRRDAEQRHADQRRQIDALAQMVPQAANESAYLAQLATLARRTGLSLQEFRPSQPVHHDTHAEIPIRLVAAGGYESACRFLHGLDGLPRLYDVTQLRLGRADGDAVPGALPGAVPGAVPGALSFEMSLKIYYQPGKAPLSLALRREDRHVQ
jgi:Tfp pilus assembly protein PilO